MSLHDGRRKKAPSTPATRYTATFKAVSNNGSIPVKVDLSARSEAKATELAWKEMEILFPGARYSWALDSLVPAEATNYKKR